MPIENTPVADNINATPLPNPGLITDKLINSQDYMGVELELERCMNQPFYESLRPYWEDVHEDSLRFEGIELRFSSALNGMDIIHAMEALDRGMRVYDVEPYVEGHRGSTHVHLNISNLSIKALHDITMLAYFCEPILMDFCEEDRHNNSFTVPISRTKDQIVILKQIKAGNLNFETESYKYRAIGLNSIYGKGSLEFRMFHSTYNTVEILKWINFIQEIKRAALFVPNLVEILESVPKHGITTVICRLFRRDVEITPRARKRIWTFVRDLTFNNIEDISMEQTISEYYRKVME